MKKIIKNIPNALTISRIVSSIVAPISLLTGNMPLAIGLYIYGAISDMLDGLTARKLNAFTELGRKLDPISDKIYALSLLVSSLILGNYLMLIPLALEGEIASTTIAAKETKINIETERVGKYKTWLLFISIIVGLLATQNPVFYFPLAPLLCTTAHFQVQSIKSYQNQYEDKLNGLKSNRIEPKTETKDLTHTKEPLKQQIKNHYDEFCFYQTIPVPEKPKKKVKKR